MLFFIVLSCLNFSISRGFGWDIDIRTVDIGLPVTLSWHRDLNDTGIIYFVLGIFQKQYSVLAQLQESSLLSGTNTTKPDRILNVTFPTSGKYIVEARVNQSNVTTDFPQTFNIAAASPLSGPGYTVPLATFNPSTTSAPDLGESSSSSTESAQSTSTAPPNDSSSESAQSTSSSTKSVSKTATAPANSNSVPRAHKNRKRLIIIGAVIGSLASLLLLFGGGIFLFIQKRRHRKLNHSLLPDPKIIPELIPHSPPAGNKNTETISPMLASEMTSNEGDRSQDTVEQNTEGDPIEGEGERRNSIGTPVHVDTSEPQSAQQEEVPQAGLDDVVAEVSRLRSQFQQFIVEREAERVQGNAFDPPPAYS